MADETVYNERDSYDYALTDSDIFEHFNFNSEENKSIYEALLAEQVVHN